MKPVTDGNVREIIQSQKRITVFFENLDPDIFILFFDSSRVQNIIEPYNYKSLQIK